MSVTGLGRIAMAEKMSVSQLQEALENKTLPAYIAAPLLEEKLNMQERMQKSAMMQQQAQQQQAPIVDRLMQRAAMGPGIETLPTNLTPTRKYAGGGIVAFGEGGEVPRYAGPYYGSLVKDPYAPTETQRVPGRGFVTPQADPEDLRRQLAQIDAQINATPAGRGRASLENKRNELRTALGMAPIVGSATRPTPADTGIEPPKVDAKLPDTAVAPPAAPAAPKTASTASRTVAPTADAGIAAGIPSAPTAPAYTGPSATTVAKGFLEGPEGYLARNIDREKRLTDELSKNRLQGKAFDTYEQSLKKEGEQAGLDKDQAKYMAMLKAGLAMMSGTSRHALENIGKGAMVGAMDYQEAYKDLRKAERERTKEFALIEQARRAEERGEIERRDNLLVRASDAARKQDEFGTQSLMNAGIEDSRVARDMWKDQYARTFDEWKTKQTIGAQERISDKQIAAQRAIAKDRLEAILARSGGRGALTANQLVQVRKEAMKNVDEAQVRSDLAKAGKLTKVPKLGEDAAFDKRVSQAYEAQLNSYIEKLLGVSSGNPFAGFSLEN